MDQEKIGKFIASARISKNMTQKELGDLLNVTDRAVSNWENGRRLPDYSLINSLCKNLDITINEFFAGEKLTNETYKEKADENLTKMLESSVFTLKDKVEFWKKKWQKEHFFELTLVMIIIVFFIIYGFIKDNGSQYLFMILGLLYGIFENNRMMSYIEKNAYGKKENITLKEFKENITRLKEAKSLLLKFNNKKEAVLYLMNETGLKKEECEKAYNILIEIDFDKLLNK